MRIVRPEHSADIARQRLMRDQRERPLVEQRSRLAIVADRLDQVGRQALIGLLTVRVRTDQRYRQVLHTLLHGPAR